jgi:hypothetical protein
MYFSEAACMWKIIIRVCWHEDISSPVSKLARCLNYIQKAAHQFHAVVNGYCNIAKINFSAHGVHSCAAADYELWFYRDCVFERLAKSTYTYLDHIEDAHFRSIKQ